MDTPVVTVLGGTGFLGESIVRHLLERGFAVRVGSRHPRRVSSRADDLRVRSVGVDIHDEASLAGALSGAHAAVNAVSLYVEHGSETFRTVHVDCAQRIATVARRVGLETLVHISGIGADAGSRSRISEAAAKANVQFRWPFQTPFSYAPRLCSAMVTHSSRGS